ncbi:hypothetical protein [Tenacibaculum sp. 190524A05c]|uniref:Uncharacterized protein n=1 Tax=Tenacibaculum platacis TaxID=3137852 RepID=A0ABM9P4I0_9FLAO
MKNTPKKLTFVTEHGSEFEVSLPIANIALTVNRYSNQGFFVDKTEVSVFLN